MSSLLVWRARSLCKKNLKRQFVSATTELNPKLWLLSAEQLDSTALKLISIYLCNELKCPYLPSSFQQPNNNKSITCKWWRRNAFWKQYSATDFWGIWRWYLHLPPMKLKFFLLRFFCQTVKSIHGVISNEISKIQSKNNLNIYNSMGVHVGNVYLWMHEHLLFLDVAWGGVRDFVSYFYVL